MKRISLARISGLLLILASCTTPPIVGPTDVINNPPVPPVQDPGADNPCDPGQISFQHEVLPIMVSACAYSGCHDANTAEDDIVLDSYEQIIKEVTPGDPNDSELYESVTETDEIMPPPPASPLNATQIQIIKDWIAQGAHNTDCGTHCDSTQASFAADIYPLLENACTGCHNEHRADGNVRLDTHAEILVYVENGSLIGTIKHETYFFPMPPSGSQLSTCRIAQIERWIADGAPNN